MKSIRLILINIFFGGLFLVSFYFLITNPNRDNLSEILISNNKPEEYMKNVFITIYDENGLIKNQLTAHDWAYHKDKSISLLTHPILTTFKPNEPPWSVSSNRGTVIQPTLGIIEKIKLLGNVNIVRNQTKTTLPMQVQTEALDFFPKRQYAESNAFVTFTKPGLTITGVGMRAYLERNFVELLHNVKTVYYE